MYNIYQQFLTIESAVPALENAKPFRYLGQSFNYSTDDQHHMPDILDVTNDCLYKINDFPCHPKKPLLYHRFVLCMADFANCQPSD